MRRQRETANRAESPRKWVSRAFITLSVSVLIAHLPTLVSAQTTGAGVAAGVAKIGSAAAAKQAVLTQLEQAVFQKINAARQARGLRPVALTPDLLAPARQHSLDMARRNVLTHADANGCGPGDRLDAAGIAWLRYGENVALCKGYSNPCDTVVDAWLKSPGHAANLLDPRLAESAVGVALASDGTYYLTQEFVTR